jgi:hypothetical protein
MSTPQLPTDVVNAITNEYALPPGIENTPEFKKQLLSAPLIFQKVQKNGENFELRLWHEKTFDDEAEGVERRGCRVSACIDTDVVYWPANGSVKSKTTIWCDNKVYNITTIWPTMPEDVKFDMLLTLVKEWRAMRECTLCRKHRRPLPGQTHCMQCVLHPLVNPPTGGSSAKRARTSSD